MKTAQELIEIIVQNDLQEFLFDSDNLEEVKDLEDVKYIQSLGQIEWKDSREDTSEFWSVIYLKDFDIYLRIEGEYDSYMEYNHDYDKVVQVFPKEIQTVIYE